MPAEQLEQPLTPEQQEITTLKEENQALRKENENLKEEKERWEQLALRDFLTEVYNSRGLEKIAKVLLPRDKKENDHTESTSAENKSPRIVVAMFDLDNFKQFNTDHGHLKANEVLKVAAQTLEQATRGNDVVGRFGGEEFVVVFTDTTAEDIRQKFFDEETGHPRVGFTILIEGEAVRVSFSGGLTEVRPDETVKDFTTILERANQAMRAAKDGGKDRIAHFEEKEVAA